MEIIHSNQNALVKEIRRLQQRKYRVKSQQYLLEGFHLIQEALAAQAPIQKLIFSEKVWQEQPVWQKYLGSIPCVVLADSVFHSLSELPAPQGIMAIVEQTKCSLQELSTVKGSFLLLDCVQDPGNVGTMVRTAAAAGFSTVILGKGCADPYGGKTLRSMQGTNFKLNLLEADLHTVLPILRERQITIYGTALNNRALDYRQLNIPAKHQTALLMGNEGQGVAPDLLALADQAVYIPMENTVESLNVAVAAGILMFWLKK